MKNVKINIKNLSVFYNYMQALNSVSIEIQANKATALIGPSGCGKTTLLKMMNRLNDLIIGFRYTGEVCIDEVNIYKNNIDVVNLRKLVGMVFQSSNLFPSTIYENLAFVPKLQGIKTPAKLNEIIEETCLKAGIWNEIKDRLNENALNLSAGQQQRLCIARALANNPDILIFDEPASALDPISTNKIEELIYELKQKHTVLLVTHNLQQAARISDYTAFLYMGQLIEHQKTTQMFTNPINKQTEDYLTGRFG